MFAALMLALSTGVTLMPTPDASTATPNPLGAPRTARGAVPTPTTPPRALSPVPGVPGLDYGGQLRAYDFNRENGVQNASNQNRSAFNASASLHLDYDVARSPVHIATTYFGAYPFGANGPRPQANSQVDNTVPGFALSTFDEAYLRYRDARTSVTLGDQIINTPWALPADTRLKPVGLPRARRKLRAWLTRDARRLAHDRFRTPDVLAIRAQHAAHQ